MRKEKRTEEEMLELEDKIKRGEEDIRDIESKLERRKEEGKILEEKLEKGKVILRSVSQKINSRRKREQGEPRRVGGHGKCRKKTAGVPLQGHTADKARPLLPGELHPQGKKQQQVRQEGGPASDTQAAQELRAHEAPDGAMD